MGKNLDNELAEAAGLNDGDDTSADNSNADSSNAGEAGGHSESMTVPVASSSEQEPSRKRSLIMLVALLSMVAGIVGLFMFGIDDVQVYSMPLAKFTENQEKYDGQHVRIEGELVPGTLKKRDDPCEYRFRLRDGDANLDVRFPQCIVPEALRDVPEGGVEVTAEGKMNGDHFVASSILAKCASKYDPVTHTFEKGGEKDGEGTALDAKSGKPVLPAAPSNY